MGLNAIHRARPVNRAEHCYPCSRCLHRNREKMKDTAFSQTLKKPSSEGAALSPRRRPSRRSSPRRWLLIFELVQNFHNTATAADARVRRVHWRGRRVGRKRETSKRERKDEEEKREEEMGERGESCRDEGECDARGMESPSASDGFELGKVQAAQKRHPSAPTPLSFRLAAPLRDSPCSLPLLPLFLALSPLTPIDVRLAFLRGLSRRPRLTLDCLTLPLYQAHLLRLTVRSRNIHAMTTRSTLLCHLSL